MTERIIAYAIVALAVVLAVAMAVSRLRRAFRRGGRQYECPDCTPGGECRKPSCDGCPLIDECGVRGKTE